MKKSSPFGRSLSHGYDDPSTQKRWNLLIKAALKWFSIVERDWIKANRRVIAEYPQNYRTGITPNALVRESVPDLYRLDKELGRAKYKQFVHLVESGFFMRSENTEVETMTAARFFDYCKIAYTQTSTVLIIH